MWVKHSQFSHLYGRRSSHRSLQCLDPTMFSDVTSVECLLRKCLGLLPTAYVCENESQSFLNEPNDGIITDTKFVKIASFKIGLNKQNYER